MATDSEVNAPGNEQAFAWMKKNVLNWTIASGARKEEVIAPKISMYKMKIKAHVTLLCTWQTIKHQFKLNWQCDIVR